MNTVLIIESFVLLLGFYFIQQGDSDKSRKNYVFIVILLLILESGLRGLSVGPDTYNYYYWFEATKDVSWENLIQSFSEKKDPGFQILMKSIQLFIGNFNFFLIIVALLFFIPLGVILFKYSSHIMQLVFAFTLYLSLFHIIALSGVRQQIAMGLSFIAFLLIEKSRYFYASILLLLGTTIHASLWIFFSILILRIFINSKYYKTIHLGTLIAIPAVYISGLSIVGFMVSFLSDEYYEGYLHDVAGGANTYIILMELLSFLSFIFIKREFIRNNQRLSLFYINLPLLTFCVPLINLNGAMIRIGQYFTIYMMLIFPYTIDCFSEKKGRMWAYSVSIIILLSHMLLSTSFQYVFFWQK